MQTFVLDPNFHVSASQLDTFTLNQQRTDAMQLLYILTKPNFRANNRQVGAWQKHPCVAMWRGHELALVNYIRALTDEHHARGGTDGLSSKLSNIAGELCDKQHHAGAQPPWWVAIFELHEAHRAELLRRFPTLHWYTTFKWTTPPSTPMWWPINLELAEKGCTRVISEYGRSLGCDRCGHKFHQLWRNPVNTVIACPSCTHEFLKTTETSHGNA